VENKLLKIKSTSAKQWMVVYTRSRFEKKIDKNLRDQNIMSFCPVMRSKNKWADRIKTVETPLFASYLFVNVNQYEFQKVKSTTGVLSFVSHCQKPVTVSEQEIERIRKITEAYADVEVVQLSHLNVGDRVKIKEGSLLNVEGVVSRVMGKLVLMTIESMDCALVVKVGLEQLALNEAS
jgi:transcription antitermination factor NusG